MDKPESIEAFYQRKFGRLPDNFGKELGHFNLFRLEPFVEGKPAKIPYRRRDFYKIMLVKGSSKVHYADRIFEINNLALSFSNPQIPYKWEHLDTIREGVYCIFDVLFFHQFGNFQQYDMFQPGGTHVFELTGPQYQQLSGVFERMFNELGSDYKYKYDLIRNLIFELLHFALKQDTSAASQNKAIDASQRVTMLFLELLERQFPIDDHHSEIHFRTPSEFAHQLNIHVNYLNRALNETIQKTTSQVIAERILQEARILLRHSTWSISEIAYALGFAEPTHFSNFFKKHTQLSPSQFREV